MNNNYLLFISLALILKISKSHTYKGADKYGFTDILRNCEKW